MALLSLVYLLAPTDINQSAAHFAKMSMTIISRISLIIGLFTPEQVE